MARANWFRNALIDRGIQPCIPSRNNRLVTIPRDTVLYQKRLRIENMFARIKDWRRIATRYDRCADLFLSACALAAIVLFWLWVLTPVHWNNSGQTLVDTRKLNFSPNWLATSFFLPASRKSARAI